MSIRFTLTNRKTGAVTTVDAPRRGEHVKDGKVNILQPAKAEVEGLCAVLKGRSKLGLRGGVLA